MTTVIAFFMGALVGAVGAFVFVSARYGTDADEYYAGADHGDEN